MKLKQNWEAPVIRKKCTMLKLEEIQGNYPVYPRPFTAET